MSLYIDWEEYKLPEGTQSICDYPSLCLIYLLWSICMSVVSIRIPFYVQSRACLQDEEQIIVPHIQGQGSGLHSPRIGDPRTWQSILTSTKNNFVYGLDRQTPDKNIVIVTEGQLDAIVTDGVAIGSNNINEDPQILLII